MTMAEHGRVAQVLENEGLSATERRCPRFTIHQTLNFLEHGVQPRARLASLLAERPPEREFHRVPCVFEVGVSQLAPQPVEPATRSGGESPPQLSQSLQLPEKRRRMRGNKTQQLHSPPERSRRTRSSADAPAAASADPTGFPDTKVSNVNDGSPAPAYRPAQTSLDGADVDNALSNAPPPMIDDDQPPPDPPEPVGDDDVPIADARDDEDDIDIGGEPMDMDPPEDERDERQRAHPDAASEPAHSLGDQNDSVQAEARTSEPERSYGTTTRANSEDEQEYGDDPLLQNDEDAIDLTARGRRRAGAGKSKPQGPPHKRLREQMLRRQSAVSDDNGLRIANGIRRSARKRMKPLEFWRNERKVYKRKHKSFNDVLKVEQK